VLVELVTEIDNCIDVSNEDCRLRILVLSTSSCFILLHVDAAEEGISWLDLLASLPNIKCLLLSSLSKDLVIGAHGGLSW
jgi:hypothetical protein